MKHKLIAVALIIFLLSIFVGSNICCTTTTYDLTISSTAGGNVTLPGEGTYAYPAGTVVSLVATPDADYVFDEWTGDVGTVANVNAATTTITMNGDYTITANFGLNMTFIDEVPDVNQPPTVTPPLPTIPTNYCAPMAMVNILEYWDDVMEHANAQNVTAGLIPETAAEYIGYFMDTNNVGSPARVNPGFPGTFDLDIIPGAWEFVWWDNINTPAPPPPFPLPAGKLGYNWTMTLDWTGLVFYTAEIDAGRPLVASFSYWNPVDTGIAFPDPATGETIDVFDWGPYQSCSESPPDPDECWEYGEIGHAVTGVGYKLNWDPDGSGPLLADDYVIVHDNWPTTPENVAIPWDNWLSNHAVDPS